MGAGVASRWVRLRGGFDSGRHYPALELRSDARRLIVATKANAGAEATLLRRPGLAQLMMQARMFVAVERFKSSMCPNMATHFRHNEDAFLRHSVLNEKPRRLSAVGHRTLLYELSLLNEPFVTADDLEGDMVGERS